MAYTSNVPLSTDRFKDSQPVLLNNFMEIASLVAVNHEAFNLPDQGKHKFVTMPVQAAAPPVGAFVAGETGFYNFLNPIHVTFVKSLICIHA